MKLALIGATGYVGSKLLAEALRRGHPTTAIVRRPERLPRHPWITAVKGDVSQTSALAGALADHEAVISAFNPGLPEGRNAARSMIDAVKRSGVPRLLVVGGAGSLEIAPGQRLVDQPDFPEQWRAGALATAHVLDLLSKERELDWTFLSPAAALAPGLRTGTFRVGGDQLLTDPLGKSRISLEDYAVAMIDEFEEPRHRRRRFCVAY